MNVSFLSKMDPIPVMKEMKIPIQSTEDDSLNNPNTRLNSSLDFVTTCSTLKILLSWQ